MSPDYVILWYKYTSSLTEVYKQKGVLRGNEKN